MPIIIGIILTIFILATLYIILYFRAKSIMKQIEKAIQNDLKSRTKTKQEMIYFYKYESELPLEYKEKFIDYITKFKNV